MKTIVRRTLAAALAGTMAFSFAACSNGGDEKNANTQTQQNGKVFAEPTEISIVVGSHPSWPFNAEWNMWRYMGEATNAKLDIKAIPNTDMATKVALMMTTPENLPDLITNDDKLGTDTYAKQGALIAIDDYMDLMPNYTKFWNSLPEEERNERLMQHKSADGKTYYPQVFGTDSRQGIRAWMYRKDIFEKHNLKVPTTMDELYDVSLQLKKLYPNSYPLCQREGLRNIGVMGSLWKPYFTWELYYDFDNSKWSYGAIEPTMLEIVKYMRKMNDAKLLPPDYLTINTKSWEELMSTNRGFIMADFAVRVDNFNTPNRKKDPSYTLAAMVPPKPNSPTATTMVNKFNVDQKSYMICNTGKEERIKNTIRLIDWMYTDQAAELLSWGKEGETFEVTNSEKHFIRPKEGDIEGEYGVFSYGTYLRVDPKAAIDIASKEQAAAINIALDNTLPKYNPALWIGLTDDGERQRNELNDSIKTYTEEMLSKFLLGQEPLTKWDEYVKTIKDSGIDQVIKIYEDAYGRVTKK